jgi:hypothetical protein
MKSKVMFMFVLAMASVSFGGIITFDFEGADPVGVGGGTIVEENATSGTHSLKIEKGGWGVAFTFNDSAEIRNALGTVGKITLDVTTAGFPKAMSGGDIGVFMMGEGDTTGGGFWGITDWAGGLVVGTTQTITLQLSPEMMAKAAGANWWWQGGIGINAPVQYLQSMMTSQANLFHLLLPRLGILTISRLFRNRPRWLCWDWADCL